MVIMPTHRKLPQPREVRRPPGGKVSGAKATPRVAKHSLFGDIPLAARTTTDGRGQTVTSYDYDHDYRPPLPLGAVRGEPRAQHFCPMCHIPRYFYVDQARRCVSCGCDFVFSGAEQKYWFENLKFHFDSVAIRCLDCRRKLRGERALLNAIQRSRAAFAERPTDPKATLAVAEAIVRLHEHAGHGNLNEAISQARKAAKLGEAAKLPGFEALCRFWEAKVHALAGRPQRAEPLFREALDTLPASKQGIALRAEAVWHLDPARNAE